MTSVTKSYNIIYGNSSSSTWTVSSNTTNVTLQSLTSGTNYTITVVTVGVRGYQSLPVSGSVYTNPSPPRSLIFNTFETNRITLSWGEPVNMTDVIKSYNITYGNSSSSTWTVSSNTTSVTIQSLTSGTNYTITVVTVGVRGYQSLPVSRSVYTSLPDQLNNAQVNLSPSGDTMDVTFAAFDKSNGPIVAYAVIMTTEMNGNKPLGGILSKTYNDFKNKTTNTYVTCIIEPKLTLRSVRSQELNVQVGDGSKTHSYVNGPLDPQLQYRVSIAGFTAINYDPYVDTINEGQSTATFTSYTDNVPTTTNTPNTSTVLGNTSNVSMTTGTLGEQASTQTSNTGTIVGAVIGSLVGVSAVSILGFLFWRKKRQRKQYEETSTSGRPAAVKSENFEEMFNKLKANNNKNLIEEYESLRDVGTLQPSSVALRPANTAKNQKDGVFPYDKSRVKLSTFKNSTVGYINASYIPGYRTEKEFIAAQNPLLETVSVFWCMIWENQINTIVMLSKCLENDKVQSEEYWPSSEDKTFGDIKVTLISENTLHDWTVRDFKVTNVKNSETRQVRQFHFMSWTENGDLNERDILLQFINLVLKHRKEYSPNCPTLVHCRAGAGRSGIFIALDRIINQLEDTNSVDLYETVHNLHLHRSSMVQTEAQYMFLHQCTLDIIRGENEARNQHNYQTVREEVLYEEIPNAFHSKSPKQKDEGVYSLSLN
ncbi:receptor-type tyrosine-protein phosphatase eta-like [Mixophyes fleayi]|uniref:receptor-type tyrosine-protein phosphatase eta-like n=1 Tax=Mixophyes fleayi TaxID=3061075 RepID=UPI003F4D97C5